MLKHKHGKILVCGPLVMSLIVGMSVSDTSGKAVANLEYESVKHLGPVFIGDTIYSQSEILDCTLTSDKKRGIIYMETVGINQNDEKILSLRRKFLVPCKPDGV
jgi:acyl dehydratase